VDCARVDEELVGFQLAALDGATRAAVEAHLTGCVRCVSSFLALKRAIDAGEGAFGPSEIMRQRIRREAEKELSGPEQATGNRQPATGNDRKPPRRARWAIVATAAAAMIAAPLVYRAMRGPATPTATTAGGAIQSNESGAVPVSTDKTVDTARTTPENLAFL
jgi:anti-sigma factor RsiW